MSRQGFASIVDRLNDVMILGAVIVSIPIVLFLLGLPVVLVAWLIAGVAARW